MTAAELFKSEVDAVMKSMDNTSDLEGAIRRIMFAVYTKGVRMGAVEGYNVGFQDGKHARDGTRRTRVADDVLAGASSTSSRSELRQR